MALVNIGQSLVRLSSANTQYSCRRLYARWTHRQPTRVMLQELPSSGGSLKQDNVIDLDPEVLQKPRERKAGTAKATSTSRPKAVNRSEHKSQSSPTKISKKSTNVDIERIKQKQEKIIDSTKKSLKEQNVFDENGDLVYEKLKENDGRVSTLLIKLKSKKERARFGQILVEGWRLVSDGIQSKCILRYIIFSRLSDLDILRPHLPSKGVRLYKVPYKEIKLWSEVDTPPGIFGVFETPTPENIVRGSKPFPLHIICDNIRTPGNLGAILRAAVGVGCERVYLTKGCVDMWEPKVVRSASGAHFSLPIHDSLEWEQIAKLVHPDTSVIVADNHSKIELRQKIHHAKKSDEDPELALDHIEDLNVPILPYYGVDYSGLKSITLIIGGETEGISEHSYRFAATRNGLRVNIPLQKGVDSLNTGMATAVIAFEIKKQILEGKAKERDLFAAY